MAIVSMAQALKDGDKVFIGDLPVNLTAPGRLGMAVGAGETLGKLVQAIVLRDQFGPSATQGEKVEALAPIAARILKESSIFTGTDFDIDPNAEDFHVRRQVLQSGVEAIVHGLVILMGLAKVDIEAEKAQMEATMRQLQMQQAAQNAGQPMAINRR